MAKRQSPKLEVESSTPSAPAIVQDPTEPCPVCHPKLNGVETEVSRRWKPITGGFDGPAIWWLSTAGVWICKTCHPPACPEIVVRELDLRDVAKREGSRPGTEECAGSNPVISTNNADAGETVNPAGL